MTTCNCGSQLQPDKRGRMYCAACKRTAGERLIGVCVFPRRRWFRWEWVISGWTTLPTGVRELARCSNETDARLIYDALTEKREDLPLC